MVDEAAGIDQVAGRLAELGAYARPQRQVLAMLAVGNASLDVLIRDTALPRRSVEELLRALADDLLTEGSGMRLRPEVVAAYRDRFGLDGLVPADPELPADLLATMTQLIAAAPKPVRALDHVPATPETAVRRALWMNETYDLTGATLLCLGDHDLTSLATCLVNPAVRVIVADVDDNLLAFLDGEGGRRGFDLRTAYGDFRFGLPGLAVESADLVFTDPPYTPEGVRLFLARGLQGLRDRANGRLLLAYGYGTHQPTLGLKVQQAVQSLSIVYEAILPHFNSYVGAQAVGSASDLSVCRPTPPTWKALDRLTTDAARIYTHGAQSLEGSQGDITATLLEPAAGHPPVSAFAAVTRPALDDLTGLTLAEVFTGAAQSLVRNARSATVAVDLSDDPGPWLVRTLLTLNAHRLVVAVPNKHPAITSESAQTALRDLVGTKWHLRFRRSTPDPRHAVVEATEVDPSGLSVPEHTRRLVLDSAHRTLANAWRDALVKSTRRLPVPLSKPEAQSRVTAPPDAHPLLDLPLHQLKATLDAVATSATPR